ncbi:hypothetical protein HLV39_03725 [Marinobacter adhaerens]|uniref:Lipoprotein n=1 Tax=Marinobacter adhaerens TaxID=1033846 RepID=A0A851HX97_9GAMM|nr:MULTISPECIES: hypothetical protein [Marinobacter]NWN90611.1 hypothetical protein [Marinobacter adhaerens]
MLKGLRQASTGGIVVVSFALMLSACGGGDDSDSGGSGGPSTELKPGVYDIGTDMGGVLREGLSLISPTTGEFVSGFVDNVEGSEVKAFAFGNIKFSSGKISGSIVEYKATPSPWKLIEGTLSGDVVSSERADLIASKNGKVNSISVLLRRSGVSDSGITLEKLSATYSTPDSTSAITITENGEITGDAHSCSNILGEVVIPDTSINVFKVTYKAEAFNCSGLPSEEVLGDDLKGEYSGLGTFDEHTNKLIFYTRNDNEKVAWMFEGIRH